MKTVAIVGAGPAGLVAAKTLLRYEKDAFRVTVFEKQDRVGGMWALRPDELHRGKCNPQMPTNLSRFSVSFSDLAWQSVDLQEQGSDAKVDLPMYPKAWQVGRYLQEYANRSIPADSLKLNSVVTDTSKVETDGRSQWRVKWSNVYDEDADLTRGAQTNGHAGEAVFDHLIVGSGFFGAPRDPSFEVGGTDGPKVLHSSRFRVLDDLIEQSGSEQGNIVVIGGGMSGSEAAVAVAMARSNALYAPGVKTKAPTHKIIHITSRPFYDIPRMNPQADPDLPEDQTDHAPGFLPNDLSMFNLSKMPPGRIIPNNGLAPPEKAEKVHPWMHSIIGSDQSDLGAEGLHFSDAHLHRPGFIGITDNYTEFVRSGTISTALGRVTRLDATGVGLGVLCYHDGEGQEKTIHDVVGVVHATGFNPHSSLSYIDRTILQDLEHDEKSQRLPLILSHHTTYNASHPDLAFVGMYEGPFWGIMEAQSREIAQRWTSSDGANAASLLQYDEPDMRELRQAMLENRAEVPQFWMRDYLQMVECLAARHGVRRADEGFGGRAGPIAAARYTLDQDDRREAQLTIADLQNVMKDHIERHRFVEAAVFRGLQGRWVITRKLDSRLPGFPSGILQGHAYFHPRFPTSKAYQAEYLYVEEGTLTTDAGMTLNANKRYAYRYSEAKDRVSVWFVKEDGRTIDYFFHDIVLSPRSKASSKEGWHATGSHWCDPDQYDCKYTFKFKGATLLELTVTFVVKGPKKDYISETRFERPKIA